MAHSKRCEYAKGSVCRCSCGGRLHGIRNKEDETKEEDPEENAKFTLPKEDDPKNVLNLTKWMEEEINNDKQ